MIVFLFNQAVQGQERKGFEGYYYPSNGGGISSISVKLFNQTRQGWYSECRYNYEEDRTAGVSVGKTFSRENVFSYSVTPELGLVVGKLQGASLGLNTSLSYKRLSISSSLLYTVGREKEDAGLSSFNWSEVNIRVTKYLYTGVTLQITTSGDMVISREPGAQLGIMFKNWAFPLYVFDRAGDHPYFTAGACYEWKK